MRTERLFEKDGYLRTFSACVIAHRFPDNKKGVVLDKTLFYPASGGQPSDRGCINDISVLDAVESGEEIIHIVEDTINIGTTVHGEIDWNR